MLLSATSMGAQRGRHLRALEEVAYTICMRFFDVKSEIDLRQFIVVTEQQLRWGPRILRCIFITIMIKLNTLYVTSYCLWPCAARGFKRLALFHNQTTVEELITQPVIQGLHMGRIRD